MPVSKTSILADRSVNAGGSRWIDVPDATERHLADRD
jgi:hypothetical protein